MDPNKLKVNELKEELKKLGESTKGTKAELVARLTKSFKPPTKEVDDSKKRSRESDSSDDEKKEDDDSTIKKVKTDDNKKDSKSEVESDSNDSDAKSIMEWLTLPLSTFKTNLDYENYFIKLADFLLNEVVIQVNGRPHRMTEIEFYFTNSIKNGDEPPIHEDPFTHCGEVQFTTGNWYFHKHGSNYKGGTYKGLDISIGQGPKQAGGILLRSIEDVASGDFACGSCKVVDHILEVCKVDSIPTLVDEKMKKDIKLVKSENDKEKILYLEKSKLEKRRVFSSARVGLHMTKKGEAEPQKTFVFKNYRYFTNPKKINKGAFYMIAAMTHQGMTKSEIEKVISSKGSTIEKYAGLYEEGKAKKNGDSFVGKKMSDDQVCIAYGALTEYFTK